MKIYLVIWTISGQLAIGPFEQMAICEGARANIATALVGARAYAPGIEMPDLRCYPVSPPTFPQPKEKS